MEEGWSSLLTNVAAAAAAKTIILSCKGWHVHIGSGGGTAELEGDERCCCALR